MAPGQYYLQEAVTIKENAQGRSIRFCGAGKDKTIITGACSIAPQWQTYKGEILVAQIGKGLMVDALFANGEKQVLARYPNFVADTTLNGYSADAISEERVARWHNPQGGYIRALHHAEWGGNSYIIDGKNEAGELLYHWVGDNNRGNQMHVVKRMVENIFEELDAPQEWYYNKQEGNLYFWPAKELNCETANFEIVTTEELFRIEGTLQQPIKDITFEEIGFAHTHRTLFTGQYERPLRGDWGMVRMAAIALENTQNIQIKNCCFNDIGGNAILMSGYNKGNVVDWCDFTGVGATGVLLFGKMSAVRDPSCYDGENNKTIIADYTPGPKDENYPRQNVVANCYFYDIGVYEKQTAAVCMSISHKNTVQKCTVHHTSRAGINIHDGTFGGHIIEDNDLFDTVTETADHGPINCWGRDRYWSVPQHDGMGYYGREKRPFALLDAIDTSIIRGNRVHANYAFGIDIDDGASNYDIYNNLCIGVGIKLRDGFDRKVHNNIMIGAGLEFHMTFAANNDLVYTNIIANKNICNELCINEGATTLCTNNFYWAPSGQVANLPKSDVNSQQVNPQFVDFAGNDFTLKEESPALKHGFINFMAKDENFGRKDKPKPPLYQYVEIADTDKTFRYYDVLLSEISNEGIRSAAGLPDYSGVFIAERDVLGLFCKLGLPIGVGDVIRSIDGQEINNAESFIQILESIPLQKPVPIVFFRSQKLHSIVFTKEVENFTPIAQEATEAWEKSEPMLYKD